MIFGKVFTAIFMAIMFALSAHAVVVDIFHDEACTVPAGQRNVWDNSCAPTGSFSSLRIVTAGGEHQVLRAHNANNCANSWNSCMPAQDVGTCYKVSNNVGACNALGSFAIVCS